MLDVLVQGELKTENERLDTNCDSSIPPCLREIEVLKASDEHLVLVTETAACIAPCSDAQIFQVLDTNQLDCFYDCIQSRRCITAGR